MMRDSGSLKLYWSPSRGPGTGGVGGRPPGRRPVVRSRSARCASLASSSPCSAAARSWARASSTALACASRARRSSRRAISARTTSPSGTSGCSLCSLKANNSSTSLRSCASTSSNRMSLTALCLEASAWILVPSRLIVPSFSTPASWASKRTWTKRSFSSGKKVRAIRGQRIVVGVQVTRDEAERHRLIGGALDLTRTEDSGGIAREQQAQQHLGGVGFPAARPVMGIQGRQVKLSHAVHDKARQMVGGQAIAQAHGQIECLVVVHGFEGSFHAHQYTITDGQCLFLSDKLLEGYPLSTSCSYRAIR